MSSTTSPPNEAASTSSRVKTGSAPRVTTGKSEAGRLDRPRLGDRGPKSVEVRARLAGVLGRLGGQLPLRLHFPGVDQAVVAPGDPFQERELQRTSRATGRPPVEPRPRPPGCRRTPAPARSALSHQPPSCRADHTILPGGVPPTADDQVRDLRQCEGGSLGSAAGLVDIRSVGRGPAGRMLLYRRSSRGVQAGRRRGRSSG